MDATARTTRLFEKFSAFSDEHRKAAIAYAEALMAYNNVLTERSRRLAIAYSVPTRDNVGRYVEYDMNETQTAGKDLISATRELLRVNAEHELDSASEALTSLIENLGEGFTDLREEASALFSDVKDRTTRRAKLLRDSVATGLTKAAERVAS